MATVLGLAPEVLSDIAQQISNKLSKLGQITLSSGQKLEIGESFPVWMLPLSFATDPDPDTILDRAAIQTGYWHHQIRHGGQAKEFATSRPLGPTATWRVEEIAESPLAEAIDVAVGILDQQVLEEVPVRLLKIPSYLTEVFWIGAGPEAKILVIRKPDTTSTIDIGGIYPAGEFIRRLAQNQFVIGPLP